MQKVQKLPQMGNRNLRKKAPKPNLQLITTTARFLLQSKEFSQTNEFCINHMKASHFLLLFLLQDFLKTNNFYNRKNIICFTQKSATQHNTFVTKQS